MQKILVPTDFSPNALRAISYAVEIARRNQASIYLVHACDTLLDNVFPGQEKITQEYNENIISKANQNLDILRNSIEETEKILVNTQLYKGPIRETIRVASIEHKIDLVIMGTLGKSGLKEKILGSKTAAVISQCEKPVLAIPLEYEWSEPAKFLLAVKDFEEATSLLSPVKELAALFDAELQLAIFTDEEESTAVGYMQHARAVHHMEDQLRKSNPELHTQAVHLSGNRFLETLNDYVAENNIDMVAMITHPRNLVDSLFNRSLTRKMAYQSKVPLLAIPAKS